MNTRAIDVFYLKDIDINQLTHILNGFLNVKTADDRICAVEELENHLIDFYNRNNQHQQAAGAWSITFIHELILNLYKLTESHSFDYSDFLPFLINLPISEESPFYQPLLASIDEKAILPLTPQRYFFLVQMCLILIDLESEKAKKYLEELSIITDNSSRTTLFSLFILMLKAKFMLISLDVLASQLLWLQLITSAWVHLDCNGVVYFLAQWLIALDWIRPVVRRKEVLFSLDKVYSSEENYNKAIILYEIFSIHDKTMSMQEKYKYLTRLLALPPSLLSVDQLQEIYYFSGNIKSAMESSFKDSVIDYQYSNYYTYKKWEKLRKINYYLRKHLSPEDYVSVQAKVEVRIVQLINHINIQNNVYVETLQSNFQKIEELYHQVEELSITDTLTGLHNRRYLMNNINELLFLSVRHKTPITVCMIDIDHFKETNDQYGHLWGDYVLKELANIMRSYFRKSDFIIRYGGEEFLVVLFDADYLEAELLMDGLRLTVAAHDFVHQRQNLHITISIGFATFILSNESDIDINKMIVQADIALYESKNKGRNCISSRLIQ